MARTAPVCAALLESIPDGIATCCNTMVPHLPGDLPPV
jgi:hypothetical protein